MSIKMNGTENDFKPHNIELICKCSFFEGLSAEETNKLNEFSNVITLSKSEILFKEGEVPTGLYIITK
jgi:CRP-like cAMP-binding protein